MGKRVFSKKRHIRRGEIHRGDFKTYKYIKNKKNKNKLLPQNIYLTHSIFNEGNVNFSNKINVSSETLLKIETPPNFLLKLKHIECAEFLECEFIHNINYILHEKSSCEVCGLNNPSLMTAHYIYKNIIKSHRGKKEIIRIFERVECICIYCHRVKHLLNILETNCKNEDITMDLKWLKAVNNFNDMDIIKYFKEVKEMNNQMRIFDREKFCSPYKKIIKENIKNNFHLNQEVIYFNNCLTNNSLNIKKQKNFSIIFYLTLNI